MRALRIEREYLRRQTRRAVGISPFGGRLLVPQARGAGLDPEILALPQNTDDLTPLIDLDTGVFMFVLDFSALDGSDALG